MGVALVHAHIRFAVQDLQAVADGLHGPLPAVVFDLVAAQAQDGVGIDAAFLVDLESGLHDDPQRGGAVAAPFLQAFVDKGLGRPQPLVEADALIVLAFDAVTAVERLERDIALVPAQLRAVTFGGQFHEGGDVAHQLQLERLELPLHGLDLGHLFAHQLVAGLVDLLDLLHGDQAAARVFPIAVGDGDLFHVVSPCLTGEMGGVRQVMHMEARQRPGPCGRQQFLFQMAGLRGMLPQIFLQHTQEGPLFLADLPGQHVDTGGARFDVLTQHVVSSVKFGQFRHSRHWRSA